MIEGYEPLTVIIDNGEPKDIISSLKTLRRNAPSSPVIEEQKAPFILSSIGKKEKGKGKKDKTKGKGNKDKSGGLGEVSFLRSDAPGKTSREDEDDEAPFNFLDIDYMYRDDYDDAGDDVTDSIANEEKRKYKKRDTEFEKKFDNELTALYELLEDINRFGKGLEKKYAGMESTKVRGMSKYTSDLIVSILSSKTSKLQIIKEIANIKKTIQDLKMKSDKETAKGADENSREQVAAAYLSKISNKVGRNEFLKGMESSPADYISGDTSDKYSDAITNLENRINNVNSEHEEDRFFDIIERRLEDERETDKYNFRAPEADIYLKYENDNVRICVKRCVDTGEAYFIGVTQDDREIPDYPVPDMERVRPIKYSADGKRATDKIGMTYRVIEYFSNFNDDED